jgi:ComF family protein
VTVFPKVAAWLDAAASLVLPRTCEACGTNADEGEGFCRDCGRRLLELLARAYCPRCGDVLGEGLSPSEDGCFNCPPTPPRYGRIVRLTAYEDPVRRAIHRMKYSGRCRPPARLCRLLAEAVTAGCEVGELDLVVPVPMYWLRRLGRGWNHSTGLAGRLATRLGLPLDEALLRVRNTPPQVRLSRTGRSGNVRGAFAARRPGELDGARVLLVDDVVTTGATVNEATRTLRKAGAASVIVAALAKARPPRAYADQERA